MSSAIKTLLNRALPLIPQHGFSRRCLVEAGRTFPNQGMSEEAITTLLGDGLAPENALVQRWLDEGVTSMRLSPAVETSDIGSKLKVALSSRLDYNGPVLEHLTEGFANLAAAGSIPLSPIPALQNAAAVSDEALHLAGDTSLGNMWYARRTAVAAAYSTAELHQIQSPQTAHAFLERLLDELKSLEMTAGSVAEFSSFALSSWKGIYKSQGISL